MTLEEYAKKLAADLKSNPTRANIESVTNNIYNVTVNNVPITSSQVLEIANIIQSEIGTLQVLNEQYENTSQITVMQQMHQLINQANKSSSLLVQISSSSNSDKSGGSKK